MSFLVSMSEGLSRRQAELLWVFLTFVAGYQSDPLVRLQDEDLAEAAAALASTYETANRGLIYEHRPQSLVAQRLVTELKAFLAKLVEQADAAATRQVERDATAVLRSVERAAREGQKATGEGPTSALGIISRVVGAASRGQQREAAEAEARRIEPPQPMLIKP